MDFLQGNTYLLASKFYDEKTNQEIDGNRVVKAEFVFNDIVLMYGTEDPRVTYDPDSNTFLLALTEEETLSLKGSVRYQAKALLDNGTVSGSKAACSYVYDTICRTVLGDGEISPSADSQIFRFDLIDARELGTKNYEELENKPSINGTVLIGDITIDADFVNALPDNTKYAASFTISLDTTNYQLTIQLKDQDGNNIGTSQTVDLPSENAIVDASYDSITKTITFVLQSGNTFEVDVSSIVSGLVNDTRTIAGLRLNQNISAGDLRTALNVEDGASSFNENNIIAGENVTVTKSGKNVTISSTGGGGGGASSFDELTGDPYDNENLAAALNSKVDKTTTIAGVDLQDNITKSELLTALNVEDGAEVNDIASVSAGGTVLTPDSSKNVDIPVATNSGNAGVVKIDTSYGISVGSLNQLQMQKADENNITTRNANYRAIVPTNLNFAVKAALTDTNHLTMNATEKNTAQEVLGLNVLSGNSAPTTSTVGCVGQLYEDTTNNKLYICDAITEDTSTTPSTFTYTWTQLIKFTDKASSSDYGIVKVAQGRGLDFLSDGGLYVDVAGDAQITNRTIGRPIAAASLNFAVKSALTDANHLTMTSAEQATAQSVLGIEPVQYGLLRWDE